MPWCETCSRFFTPNALRADGTCPACGRAVADPDAHLPEQDGSGPPVEEDPEEHPRVPWHFWVLLLAAALYLGWRAVEGIAWLIGRI